MTKVNTFELHSFFTQSESEYGSADGGDGMSGLPWNEQKQRSVSVLEFAADDANSERVCWVGIDGETNCPSRVEREQDAVAGFTIVDRRLGDALGLISKTEGVLINGLPVLGFSVLSPRDALIIAPGVHSYVTQRIRPHVGAPTQSMIGKKCPFCRIPVTEDTRVVTCRCGVAYHHETEESHGAIDDKDRLNCFAKLRVCLSCSRAVTLEETLVWDPATL